MSEAEAQAAKPQPQDQGRRCAQCGTEMGDKRRKYCSDACKNGKPQAHGPAAESAASDNDPDEQAHALLEMGKARYQVSEVAPVLAAQLEITTDGAAAKLYRRIERGEVRVQYFLGSLRIPKGEVRRIVLGESNV